MVSMKVSGKNSTSLCSLGACHGPIKSTATSSQGAWAMPFKKQVMTRTRSQKVLLVGIHCKQNAQCELKKVMVAIFDCLMHTFQISISKNGIEPI